MVYCKIKNSSCKSDLFQSLFQVFLLGLEYFMNSLSRYAGFPVLLYIFNDDKGSPVVVELFFILLFDVYSSSSGLQLID